MSALLTAARGSARQGELPVLGLLVTDGPHRMRELLLAMGNRCIPRYAGPGGVAEAAAYVVHSSPDVPPPGAPFALWLTPGADPSPVLAATARVLLTPDMSAVAAGSGPSRLEAVPARVDYRAVAVAPFVRRRIRTVRGLAADGVAAYEDGTWCWGGPDHRVADELVDTLCGLAAAVVATTPATAVRALAWGAPLVTDPATAGSIAATADHDCLVSSHRGGRAAAAREMASDDRTAARLGWRGRLLFESRHDLVAVADRVLDRLGLPPPAVAGDLGAALAALGTPMDALVRDRVARATSSLTTTGVRALLT